VASQGTREPTASCCRRKRSTSSSNCTRPSAKTAGTRCPGCRTFRRSATSKPKYRPSSRSPRHGAGIRSLAQAAVTRPVPPTTKPRSRHPHSARVGVRVSLGVLSPVEARVSDAVQPAVD